MDDSLNLKPHPQPKSTYHTQSLHCMAKPSILLFIVPIPVSPSVPSLPPLPCLQATDEELLRAHTREHIESVEGSYGRDRPQDDDPNSPFFFRPGDL